MSSSVGTDVAAGEGGGQGRQRPDTDTIREPLHGVQSCRRTAGCLRGSGAAPRRTSSGSSPRPAAAAHQPVWRPPAARRGELVVGGSPRLRHGALRGQRRQRALDLAQHRADGDAEHRLTAPNQVDHLLAVGELVHARPVAHQRQGGQVLDAASPQMADGGADVLQRDAGVEQPLDHLEHEDVAEAVEALGARSGGRPDRRLHQTGARPVVQLAVGDLGDRAGHRPAEAHVVGSSGRQVEQCALVSGRRAALCCHRRSSGTCCRCLSVDRLDATCDCRSADLCRFLRRWRPSLATTAM